MLGEGGSRGAGTGSTAPDGMARHHLGPALAHGALHLFSMLTATAFFLLAAIFGHGGYLDGEVTSGSLVLTLIGFGFVTLGGGLVEEPALRAAAPLATPEKEQAAAE
jgi:hypothetical protein